MLRVAVACIKSRVFQSLTCQREDFLQDSVEKCAGKRSALLCISASMYGLCLSRGSDRARLKVGEGLITMWLLLVHPPLKHQVRER